MDMKKLMDREAARSHLFLWMVAVQDQSLRVIQAEYDHNREVDSTLYALALRNLLRVAELVRQFDRQRVKAALAAFEKEVPNLVKLRDILEHFDEYETGRGDLQKKGLVPREPVSIWWEQNAGTVVVNVGGFSLDVVKASDAASRLVRSLADVLGPSPFPDPPSGT